MVTLSAIALLLPAETFAQKQNVNYDEAAVAPYELPDPLVFANGKKVRKNQWPERRREILDMFQHEMYGVLPPKGDGIFLETIEEGPTLYGQGTRLCITIPATTLFSGILRSLCLTLGSRAFSESRTTRPWQLTGVNITGMGRKVSIRSVRSPQEDTRL